MSTLQTDVASPGDKVHPREGAVVAWEKIYINEGVIYKHFLYSNLYNYTKKLEDNENQLCN